MWTRSRGVHLKESFVLNLNFVQQWHSFWKMGVSYLDALSAFFSPNKPWMVVKFLPCKKKIKEGRIRLLLVSSVSLV